MSATIFAVDDDPSNLELLRDVCEASGWRVATESEGGRGLARAREVQPDVILLDIMMPGTGGLELMKALQDDEQLRSVPVVFVTAVTDPQTEDRAFLLGAVDYVRKPYRIFDLQSRIRTALEIASYLPSRKAAAQGPDVLGTQMEELMGRARSGERFGCAMVCLDGFSDLRLSHPDRAAAALTDLARRLRRSIRGRDSLYLAGEGEFVLFFPMSDRDGVRTAVERLARNVPGALPGSQSPSMELRFGFLTVPHSRVSECKDVLALARTGALDAQARGERLAEVKDEGIQ